MRILGFSKAWPKLNNELMFTTFRYPRRDRDWEIGEVVQVVLKPRAKERQPLGIARILRKDRKDLDKMVNSFPPNDAATCITQAEALADGFPGFLGGGDVKAMRRFIRQPGRNPLIHKLTLGWIEKINGETTT